jgi:hypothetical protein
MRSNEVYRALLSQEYVEAGAEVSA